MKPSAHLHLIINAMISSPPGPDDCDKISQFMVDMVDHVGMKVMIPPTTGYCFVEGNEGITSTIILTTSHSAIHIWNLPEPKLSNMQFDLYSCSKFDVMDVIGFIAKNFKLHSAKYKFLDRDNDLVEIGCGEYNKVI